MEIGKELLNAESCYNLSKQKNITALNYRQKKADHTFFTEKIVKNCTGKVSSGEATKKYYNKCSLKNKITIEQLLYKSKAF
jgi:hypothetical protein